VPPIAVVARYAGLGAAIVFAAFVAGNGIPTLRHDWTWPIDRTAIASFASASVNGWLSVSLGTPNPYPTNYLIALPIVAVMWLVGPHAALALLAGVIGWACMRTVDAAARRWRNDWPAGLGIGLFALFNPWVYNEVVAGHLVMVLAYAGVIGLFAEMLQGRAASPIRLALWIALIAAQLQFFIVAMVAAVAFAALTRKWLPPIVGAVVALPSIVGVIAERASLLRIPYEVTWQTNQSIAPLPLLGLGGYFAGYSDRLGLAASVAVYIFVALAVIGAFVARRSIAARYALGAALALYAIIVGLNGPLAAPYAWVVRNVPESGVFRELYDLAGIFAALLIVLASAATSRFPKLGYAALAVGIALPVTWALQPPGELWVAADSYPHPEVAAAPFTRIALLPAFQPLGLRDGRGDGADPDAFVYPVHVPALNEYFPTFPVDMALARYEQFGNPDALRALGVTEIVPRPWMVSRTRGAIGLAAASLRPNSSHPALDRARHLDDATPLVSGCDASRVVDVMLSFGPCDVFFGDAAGYAPLHPIAATEESIDPRTAWIDARLAFAEFPALAQAIGGALTQSTQPLRVEPNAWLLAYVHGALYANGGRKLANGHGGFAWIRIPGDVMEVVCAGLCEAVAQTASLPALSPNGRLPGVRTLQFHHLTPWLYVVDAPAAVEMLRFNERYDPYWLGFADGRPLPHVRIDMAVNGWLLGGRPRHVVLVQSTAAVQLIAQIVGGVCVLWLLKALVNRPTKRAEQQ
jgi:hypothetical protein